MAIDGAGRVRDFSYALKVEQFGGSTFDIRVDVRFSDFGVPVSVQGPSAGETVPWGQVAGLFRG